MRKIILILTVLNLFTFFACKKEIHKSAIINKNCTGTYLELDGKNFKVCNLEKISSFQDGENVTVTFKKIDECNDSGNFVIHCEMAYKFDSWIEVIKIK